jgi:hypothetical protein
VALIDEIEVCIDMDEVYRALLIEGRNDGRRYRMIPAEDEGHRTAFQDLSDRGFGIRVALQHVGVHDVDVPDVHYADVVTAQIGK